MTGVQTCALPILIANETGLEKEMIKKMFRRLRGKIDYIDGWVVIKNFIKHLNPKGEKILNGINMELSKIPKNVFKQIPYRYPIYKEK